MAVKLYPHQRKAVDKLRPGSILVGGVGTGKSRTALAYFCEKVLGCSLENGCLTQTDLTKHLYIITTARKRDTLEWDYECAPFLLTRPWVVIDSWNNIKKYADVKGAFFIFDEQRLVGKGAWVKSFLKIAKFNEWILLTATPGDTWLDYIPVFIANGFYKNRTEFIARHVVYHRYSKFPKVERFVDTKHLEKLRSKIVIPMHYKKETEQHHEWIKVEYDEKMYDVVYKERWNPFKNEPIKNASELCYILRKVVNVDIRRMGELFKILEEHPKAILFYNFDYELEALRDFCAKISIFYSEWNGKKHQPIPQGERWVYLVQYAAGAEGWNCTETDTIIFFSQSYSYRQMVQAAGRIDRLNTPYSDLYYYHLYSGSSIDVSIKACLNRKKDFNEKAFAAEFVFPTGDVSVQESLFTLA